MFPFEVHFCLREAPDEPGSLTVRGRLSRRDNLVRGGADPESLEGVKGSPGSVKARAGIL